MYNFSFKKQYSEYPIHHNKSTLFVHKEKPHVNRINQNISLPLQPHFSPQTTKNQKGESSNTKQNPVQLGGFLFIDVPPTFPDNFSPFHLPPKKGSERKRLLGF